MQTSKMNDKPELVPMSLIVDNPYQARKEYDPDMLQRLAENIKELGRLLQIPMARKMPNGKYQLAFGHQRKRACLILGWTEMPLFVEDLTDRQIFEIAIAENVNRRDLNPIEKAAFYKKYMDEFKATSREAAQLFEIADSSVRGLVRFLKLPATAQKKVAEKKMTFTEAKEILAKPETRQRKVETLEKIESSEFLNLRDRLLYYLYGSLKHDVTDEMIYRKVKSLSEENQQLQRQVEILNRQRHALKKRQGVSSRV
jgi:ParB/RepB/Spo0J family partition protein